MCEKDKSPGLEGPFFIIMAHPDVDVFDVLPEDCFPTYEDAVNALKETDFGDEVNDNTRFHIVRTMSTFRYVKELRS